MERINEFESNKEERNHPLYHDVVLETLAKYIHKRDLFSCRVVCKNWNEILVRRIRSDYQVCLMGTTIHSPYYGSSPSWTPTYNDDNENIPPDKDNLIPSFIILVEKSIQIPFGTYRIINLDMTDPLVDRFFELCGPLIRTLKIQSVESNINICGFRELLMFRAPNLQVLSIEGIGLPTSLTTHANLFPRWLGYNNLNEYPLLPNLQEVHLKTEKGQLLNKGFLLDLLIASPNLTSFTSTKSTHYNHTTLILSCVKEAVHFKTLSCLHLKRLENFHVKTLVDLCKEGLRLKNFLFEHLDSVESEIFQKLLDIQKDSLVVLTLGEYVSKDSKPMQLSHFPVMKNLKKLTRSAVSKDSAILFGGLCFMKCTPCLESLVVYGFDDEIDWSEYYSQENFQYPCESLKMLELPMNLKYPSILHKFGKMFPNITKILAKTPRNEVITELWSMWPELEELHLTISDKNVEIDSVFTGIPTFMHEGGIIDLCKSIAEIGGFETNPNNPVLIGPSIANLRGLRKLHVESVDSCFTEYVSFIQHSTRFLTDITGYFALAFLTKLEEITIIRSEVMKQLTEHFFPFNISQDCYKELVKRLPEYTQFYISDTKRLKISPRLCS